MFDRLLQWTGLKAKKTPRPVTSQPATVKARPIHVTDDDFASVILGSEQLTVVDFWADWCGPCHQMSPHIGFLAEEYAGRVVVAKLDVDENPTTPARYHILGIPTVIFFQNGEAVDRHTGVLTIDGLSERVEKLLRIA
ncbi:MAG: thioredoxin [Chloroflexi bacterium]|nr:MAG: thioredoxin [Chloroflexota bacterium]